MIAGNSDFVFTKIIPNIIPTIKEPADKITPPAIIREIPNSNALIISIRCKINLRFIIFESRNLFSSPDFILSAAELYEISGRVGSEILTSNPCGVLSEKETVPRCAFTICTTSFSPRPCSAFSSLP